MKYAPKKVFVLENDTYTEITYEELCLREESDSEYKDKLFLYLHGAMMEVTKEDYTEYYRIKRRQKYIKESSQEKGKILYDSLDTEEFNGEDILVDPNEDFSEQVIDTLMLEKLRNIFPLLSKEEKLLIDALFFKGYSERDWSKICGIPQRTINDRKRRILAKLKKLLEN